MATHTSRHEEPPRRPADLADTWTRSSAACAERRGRGRSPLDLGIAPWSRRGCPIVAGFVLDSRSSRVELRGRARPATHRDRAPRREVAVGASAARRAFRLARARGCRVAPRFDGAARSCARRAAGGRARPRHRGLLSSSGGSSCVDPARRRADDAAHREVGAVRVWGFAHTLAARCGYTPNRRTSSRRSRAKKWVAVDEAHPVAARAHDERVRARAVGEVADAAQQVAVRDAGRGDDHLPRREVVDREDRARCRRSRARAPRSISRARRRPELRLQLAAEAAQRGGRRAPPGACRRCRSRGGRSCRGSRPRSTR